MKNKLYSALMALALLATSCDKNVIFEQQDEYSDILLVTTLTKNINNQATMMQGVVPGTIVYFMDCSCGVASRKWVLESEDGYFLDSSFNDSGEDCDYSPYYMAYRSLSDESVYVEQGFAGNVKLTYKGSFFYPVTYRRYDSNNFENFIESTYNSATGLYDFTMSYEYKIYDDLDVAYIVYETDDPDNVVYVYTHADEYNADLQIAIKPNTSYTIAIKDTYGDPTSWSWSEYGSLLDAEEITFITGSNAGVMNQGNILLERSGNTVPSSSVTIPIVKFNVVVE